MSKHLVLVSQLVEVEMDEAKFDAEFMREFVGSFYPYDTIEDHARHLAQLHARGIVDNSDFIEGYGPAKDMGIRFRVVESDEEYQRRAS